MTIKINNNMQDDIIHSLKVSLSCVIAFIVQWELHWGYGGLMVISSFLAIKNQITIESALSGSAHRIINSMIGGAIAIIPFLLFGKNIYTISMLLFIGVFGIIYLSKQTNFISKGASLVVLSIIYVSIVNTNSLHDYLLILLSILIGVVISIFVSFVVFPCRNINLIKNKFSQTLHAICSLHDFSIKHPDIYLNEKIQLTNHEVRVFKLIYQQRLINISPVSYVLNKNFDKDLFNDVWIAQRHMVYSILLLKRIGFENKELYLKINAIPAVSSFHQQFIYAIESISSQLNTVQSNKLMNEINFDCLEKSIKNIFDNPSPSCESFIRKYLSICELLAMGANELVRQSRKIDFQKHGAQ